MRTWYASPTIPQHTLNFLSADKRRCEQKAHPRLGACQSEKQELGLARSLCGAARLQYYCAPIIQKSREKRSKLRRWSWRTCAAYHQSRFQTARPVPSRAAAILSRPSSPPPLPPILLGLALHRRRDRRNRQGAAAADRGDHVEQREGAARRFPAPLLLPLHPLPRRRHHARDHRCAFPRHQAAAGVGGAQAVLRNPRRARDEEEAFDLGAARLAQASLGRGYRP